MIVVDVSVTVGGVDDWATAVDALEQRFRSATRKATKDGLTLLQRRTHSRLSRYYHHPGTPTPAPPGGPPARISGHLRGSLSLSGPRATSSGFAGELGPTAPYARIQEMGGQAGRNHSVTLPPRPYLDPTVRDVRSDLRNVYRTAWGGAVP